MILELERFLVSEDSLYEDCWNIKPLEISEPWKIVFGDDWDITMSSDFVAAPLYNRLKTCWAEAQLESGQDILVCEVAVEYTFKAPPGVKSLRYGRHKWTDTDQFWFMAGGHSKQWRVVGGFVRTVNMVSVLERSHVDRRDHLEERRLEGAEAEGGDFDFAGTRIPWRHQHFAH